MATGRTQPELNQPGCFRGAGRMPAFAFNVGRFRLSLAKGAAILLVRNDAVAARVSALLRICHNSSSPELFDGGTAKAFQLFRTFRPGEMRVNWGARVPDRRVHSRRPSFNALIVGYWGGRPAEVRGEDAERVHSGRCWWGSLNLWSGRPTST